MKKGHLNLKNIDIDKFLTYLKESDMVIGTRTTRQMIEQGSNMDWLTRWANVVFAKFIELMWLNSDPDISPRLTDVGCTYRAIWRSSFEEIKNFLVTGIINKNPIKSVKNPGMISNNAAKARAAPDISS